MTRIAGIVVLYNPTFNVIENINSYRKQIDILYIIDNSEIQNEIYFKQICKLNDVVYQWNGKNLGIAKALNIGAALAFQQNYEYLLMMDQDSFALSNLIDNFSKFIIECSCKNVGILCPYHVYINFDRPLELSETTEKFIAITSGSLLSLSAYKQCGQFNDELFIDSVDFEYCLRLHLSGYRIIQVNNALLRHQLGAIEERRFFFRRIAVYNHPPIRVYYKFRNRLFIALRYFKYYPIWSLRELFGIGNDLIKIVFFEENKYDKCRMAFLGIIHGFLRQLGKFRK